jgi:hypothetical protein
LINPTRLDNALDCLKSARHQRRLLPPAIRVNTGSARRGLNRRGVASGKEAETVILFVGLTDEFESEGFETATAWLYPKHITRL